MFKEEIQKGLFTFYWEQDRKEQQCFHKPTYQNTFHKKHSPNHRQFTKIEEIIETKKHQKTQKIQSNKSKQYQGDHIQHISKEIKSILSPHSVNLSSFLNGTHQKSEKKMNKLKYISEILQTRLQQYKKKSLEISDLTATDETLRENSSEVKRKTIEIDSIVHEESKTDLSPHPIRMKKRKLRQSNRKMKQNIQQESKERLPMINLGSLNQNPLKAAYIFKRSQTNRKKKSKENFLIEKIYLERNAINGNSSVINIGTPSTDQYRLKWQKKKEEFLASINHSLRKHPSLQ